MTNRYLVSVSAYVVVEADNLKQANANGEQAVRKAIKRAYLDDDGFADGWERFGFLAKGKPEKLTDDD